MKENPHLPVSRPPDTLGVLLDPVQQGGRHGDGLGWICPWWESQQLSGCSGGSLTLAGSCPIAMVHELWFWWLRGFRGKQVLTTVVSPKQLVL